MSFLSGIVFLLSIFVFIFVSPSLAMYLVAASIYLRLLDLPEASQFKQNGPTSGNKK